MPACVLLPAVRCAYLRANPAKWCSVDQAFGWSLEGVHPATGAYVCLDSNVVFLLMLLMAVVLERQGPVTLCCND
jgi:hypothetical protein